jgi:hypothetical protein
MPDPDQFLVQRNHFPVFPAPGVSPSVERILIALHQDFIAVVDAGRANVRRLESKCHTGKRCASVVVSGIDLYAALDLAVVCFCRLCEHRHYPRNIVR